MIDTKQKAKEILEEYANCYSQVDLERLVKNLDDIKAEAIKEFLDKLIDVSVCKDNGDGTESLFVSIPKAREISKEMVGEE